MIPTDKKRCPDKDAMDDLIERLGWLATNTRAGTAVVVEKEADGDCFGSWRGDCPRGQLSGCPFFQECMEASRGVVAVEWEGPNCFGDHDPRPMMGCPDCRLVGRCKALRTATNGAVYVEEENESVRGETFSMIIIDDFAFDPAPGCAVVTEEGDQ